MRELPARSATARTILLLATMASIVLSSAIYVYVDVSTHLGREMDEPETDLSWMSAAGVGGLALTALLTTAILAAMRWRAERQGGLVELSTGAANGTLDHFLDRVDEIARHLEVHGQFQLRTMPLDARVGAHVRWGRDRRPLVVVSGGLVRAHQHEPVMVEAIVAHELAHVRNRDSAPTTIAIAAWRATVITGVLPMAFVLSTENVSWYARLSVVALILIVYLMRLDVLRSREFWADVRAAEAEHRIGLLQLLSHGDKRNGRRSMSLFHPGRRARVATLSTDDLSIRVLSLGEAVLAGIAFGVVLGALRSFWNSFLPPLVGALPAAWLSSYLPLLPAIPFLVVIARAARSARARWSVGRGSVTVVAVAAGVTLGSSVSLGLKSEGPTMALFWLGVVPHTGLVPWAPVISLGAFTVIAGLAIGWCRGVVRLCVGTERPTSRVRIAVETCVVVYGLLLFPSLQTTASLLLSDPAGWAGVDQITVDATVAAADAPWDVLPVWAREIDAGGFAGLFSYVDAMAVGTMALVVPLLGALAAHPRPRRLLASFLGAALAVGLGNTALAVGLLSGIDALAAPAREQLPQNVYDILLFVAMLAGLLVALGMGSLRRVPVLVAACAGAGLATATLAVTMASRPVRCLLTPVAAGQCDRGWPPGTLLEILLFKIAPTLLCCVVAAVVGRLLSVAINAFPTKTARSPSVARGSTAGGERLAVADVVVPRERNPHESFSPAGRPSSARSSG